MSKLTETVCIKVSEDDKEFLDSLENKSKFIRNFVNTYSIANAFIKGEMENDPIDVSKEEEIKGVWEFVQRNAATMLIAMAENKC